MRSMLLFLFMILLPLFSYGQDSVFVSRTISITSSIIRIEEFYVLKNDTSQKTGKYYLKKKNGKVIVEGQYADGIKTGIWSFYNDMTFQLYEKYDYDTGEDVFYTPFRGQMLIEHNGIFQSDSVESQPHFPGDAGFVLVLNNVKYPSDARNKGIAGIVYFSIQIDTLGVASIAEIDYSPEIKGSGFENSFKQSIENALVDLPKYIPAQKNGKNVTVRFENKMPLKFNLQ